MSLLDGLRPVLVASSCVCAACAAPAAHRPQAPAPQPHREVPVLLVQPVEGLGLFHDEARASQQALFAWGQARGLRLVALDRAEAILERARAGRRIDGDGAACGLPVSRSDAQELHARALGAGGQLEADVSCDAKTGACTLDVSISTGLGFDGDRLAHERAPFDVRAPWQAELSRALAALRPVADSDEEGGFGLIGSTPGGGVHARPESLEWSASSALARDDASFAGKAAIALPGGPAALRACFADDRQLVEALIAVDHAGRITRCESRDADDEAARCACAALSAHATTNATLRDTRAFVQIDFYPADVVTPWHGVVVASTNTYVEAYRDAHGARLWRPSVSDPSIAAWKPPAEVAIARCFADVPGPGRAEASVTVRFDASGAATAAEVKPANHSMSAAQIACVEHAFLASRAPCPATAATSARAAVEISARAITAP